MRGLEKQQHVSENLGLISTQSAGKRLESKSRERKESGYQKGARTLQPKPREKQEHHWAMFDPR